MDVCLCMRVCICLLLWLPLVLLVICCHGLHVIYGAVQICTNFVTWAVPDWEERNGAMTPSNSYLGQVLAFRKARVLFEFLGAASQVAFYVVLIYCTIFYFDLVISFYRPSCFIICMNDALFSVTIVHFNYSMFKDLKN